MLGNCFSKYRVKLERDASLLALKQEGLFLLRIDMFARNNVNETT